MSIRVEIDGLEELQAAAGVLDETLARSLAEALGDSARIVAARAQRNAAVRSGRMRASIEVAGDGTAAEIKVTARRRSRSYPGGFNYPRKIEQIKPFLVPAVRQEAQRVNERMEGVLDDIQNRWGGA